MTKWLALAFVAFTASAQQFGPVERLLVPTFLSGPLEGAFGSRWVAELTILNTSDGVAFVENFGEICPIECGPIELYPGATIAGDAIRYLHGDGPPAAILLIKPEYVERLAFQLRVRDISRSAEGYGTWFPVVRESQASVGTVHLLDVPTDVRYRLMLRIYSFEAFPSHPVHVSVFGVDTTDPRSSPDPLLSEFDLALYPGGTSQPAYAQLPNIVSLPDVHNYDRIRLELDSEGTGTIWGMVTVTNNVTQEVTAILPNAAH